MFDQAAFKKPTLNRGVVRCHVEATRIYQLVRTEANAMIRAANKLGDRARQIYRQTLLNKKAELRVALGTNIHRLSGAAEDTGADPEQHSQEESVTLRLNHALHNELRQVEYALERLESDEYGSCLACGGPIAPKRLEAVPWTHFCLLCQEKASPLHMPEKIGVGQTV